MIQVEKDVREGMNERMEIMEEGRHKLIKKREKRGRDTHKEGR